jgi:hypothetical protein
MHAFEIIGWLVVAAAASLVARKLVLRRSWKKAAAVVVYLGPERPGESPTEPISSIHFPVVRFTTERREEVYGEARDFQFGPHVVGDTVGVLYDPAKPTRFCSVNLFRRYGPEVGVALLGFFFVFIAGR